MAQKPAKPETKAERVGRMVQEKLEHADMALSGTEERHRKDLAERAKLAELRLKELERAGEVVFEERSHSGPLPVIRLRKPTGLDRIVKLAKR